MYVLRTDVYSITLISVRAACTSSGLMYFYNINFSKGCLSMDFSMIAGAVLRGSFTSTFRLTILSVHYTYHLMSFAVCGLHLRFCMVRILFGSRRRGLNLNGDGACASC